MQKENKYEPMPHLKDAVPLSGQGKRISTYTIALEGWRRGLQTRFYSEFEDGNKLKVRYSLSDKKTTHHFQLSMGDAVSKEAFDICDDKDLTKQYLNKRNVPVPEGKKFDESSTEDEILEYGLSLGFPIVVKPTDGNAGKGVFANINTEYDFREIIPYVINDLGYKNILVEKYVAGEEFRIILIEDKILGALNRKPANVVGDGISTIRELIHQKNEYRKTNPHLKSRLIKIDMEIERILREQEYDLNTIPKLNEEIMIIEKNKLSTEDNTLK